MIWIARFNFAIGACLIVSQQYSEASAMLALAVYVFLEIEV